LRPLDRSVCQPPRPVVSRKLLPGAVLVGHPYGVLGKGEDIRTSAAAFSRAGIPFNIRNTLDYGGHLAIFHKSFPFMEKISAESCYRANVFFLNADEMYPAYYQLGKQLFDGRYNIGYWSWELSAFPDEWKKAFSLVHEIWAPTRFIQQAISEKASCPVIRMPFVISPVSDKHYSREYFGLPDRKFLFLFFFDFTSYVIRKNPFAVIQAFLRAFVGEQAAEAGLVIKMNGMDLRPDEFTRFLACDELRDPRITLIDKVFDDGEMAGLVQVCDCFVSLHRSEGFGRGLAEAMYFGKPVIATGYSGNLDFTNDCTACLVDYTLVPVGEHEYPFGQGKFWAEPDVEHAAWYMKRLVQDQGYRASLGARAMNLIKSHHSPEVVGARYKARLTQLDLM
jgi:glycosyltransferase involved in cell wall biosynthesis